MWAKKVLTNKGIKEVGRRGISKIFVNEEEKEVQVYTAGGNIFCFKLKRILEDNKGYVASGRKNFNKQAY